MGVSGQRHAPDALPPVKLGTRSIGGWVGPRAGLDGCGKSRPTGIQFPDRPARSESLYISLQNMFLKMSVYTVLQVVKAMNFQDMFL